MGTTKSAITARNIHSWLAATGLIFPVTEAELDRFEKMTSDMDIPEDQKLDPDVILGKKSKSISIIKGSTNEVPQIAPPPFSMAARNGKGTISQHILDKMKNKHHRRNDDLGGTAQ